MTKIKFYAPVREMNGEFEKNSGIIMRKKKYRAPNGAVLKEGVQESYKITNPRDFEEMWSFCMVYKSLLNDYCMSSAVIRHN